MVKRLLTLTSALILLCVFLAFPAFAKTDTLRIEQVQIEMPLVRSYFYFQQQDEPSPQVSATLGGKPLELGQVRKLDPEQDKTSFFFLVDCSTSTLSDQMDAVKKTLTGFASNLPSGADVTLITFGVKVEVLLEKETDPTAITEAVLGLQADQPGTLFFDALAKAISLAENAKNPLQRKLAFVFSDSADYNLGGYTKEEIDKLLTATGLPFYALGFDTGTKEQLDNFGAVARASGGDIQIVSAASLPDTFGALIERTQEVFVAEFDAGTNITGEKTQEFELTIPASTANAAMQVSVRHWRPDNQPPMVEEITQITPESIWIVFSKPVAGASNVQSFSVYDETGNLLGIQAAAYNDAQHAVTLTFSLPPVSGNLVVDFPGITDLSMEENKVAQKAELIFEGTPLNELETQGAPLGAWVVVALVCAAAIVAAVGFGKKNKAKKETIFLPEKQAQNQKNFDIEQPHISESGIQVHFMQANPSLPRIRLDVADANGKSKQVELPIDKTLFVGRSDICEVYFDDSTMSRQHFVIADEAGNFLITNLSANQTLLNGVPLKNPRPLKDGDIIEAGQQRMVFFSLSHKKGEN